ncbi:sigma-70 family RNA polymerase sigma factor [Auraticoccus cholistanensis]|nr:sigma-70 family RNA polymerase sigma factor [Auraticoccus cholistanensis]
MAPTTRPRTDEPLLDAAEEVALARAMEAGVLAAEALRTTRGPGGEPVPEACRADLVRLREEGERARRRFLLANVRLVASEVRQAAARTSLGEDDLFQEGVLALAECLLRWDHARGTRFVAYALPWVRNRVRAAGAARIGELESPGRVGQVRLVRQEHLRLTQQLRREPTRVELAQRLERSPRWVAEALRAGRSASLDDPSGRELQLVDPTAERSLAEVLEQRWPAADELRRLPEPAATVVRARYGFLGEPMSWVAVAALVGLTVRQVQRLEREALERLREVCPAALRPAA